MITRAISTLLTVVALGGAGTVHAALELDPQQSTVQFMSVKNGAVAELHHFGVLTGSVADDGLARVVIELDSVESLIPIRNERMRKMLFDTQNFPLATITAVVPPALMTLESGSTTTSELQLHVNLHGVEMPLTALVLVTALDGGALQVVLREPLVVKAADFNLAEGIEALRDIAGLKSITAAVPVTATLIFTP